MPAKSVALKTSGYFFNDIHSNRITQRYMPELMLGLSRDWMVHTSLNFSNRDEASLQWEAVRLYGKFRFLSVDEVHKHFRIAAFGAATYSRNPLLHNEINLMMGDQSGIQAGVVATQLWNKLAVSGTISWNEVLDAKRSNKVFADYFAFTSVNYSASAGFLLLPFEYKNYDQLNINLYTELLGSRNVGFNAEKYYMDLAPSVQAIIKSTAKLNLGYRFQLAGDIYRMTNNSWMISFEYIFLNALRKKS